MIDMDNFGLLGQARHIDSNLDQIWKRAQEEGASLSALRRAFTREALSYLNCADYNKHHAVFELLHAVQTWASGQDLKSYATDIPLVWSNDAKYMHHQIMTFWPKRS